MTEPNTSPHHIILEDDEVEWLYDNVAKDIMFIQRGHFVALDANAYPAAAAALIERRAAQ